MAQECEGASESGRLAKKEETPEDRMRGQTEEEEVQFFWSTQTREVEE